MMSQWRADLTDRPDWESVLKQDCSNKSGQETSRVNLPLEETCPVPCKFDVEIQEFRTMPTVLPNATNMGLYGTQALDKLILNMHEDERPRERLLTLSSSALSNAELVAVLLCITHW
jgi:hypothetical protein